MKDRNGVDRRSLLRGTALAAVAAPALIGAASAQAEVTWRVQSHWPKASSSFNDSLGVLASTLAERTDGRFKLELFGDGEFSKGGEVYNLVRRGVVEMGTCSPAYIQDEAQAASFAYGIPGTLREPWQMMQLLKNMGVEELVNEDLNPKGVLYRTEKVYPTELVVKKPIEQISDFEALKLRSSGTMMDYLASAGAAPQMIAGSELYQALSSGVVDGAHWGAAIGAQSMSLWEVAPFHVHPALGITGDGFIVNIDALEALPDDLGLQLTSLLSERFFLRSTEYQLKEAIALADGRRDQGVTVIDLPPDVLAVLSKASTQILEKEAERGPKAEQAAEALRTLMGDLGYL